MINKYRIGDRISGGGVVYALFCPREYFIIWLKTQGLGLNDPWPAHSWDTKCPDWTDHPVYYLRFDEPVAPGTFEEFAEQNPQIHETYLYREYEKWPKVSRLAVPESELTLEIDIDKIMDQLLEPLEGEESDE